MTQVRITENATGRVFVEDVWSVDDLFAVLEADYYGQVRTSEDAAEVHDVSFDLLYTVSPCDNTAAFYAKTGSGNCCCAQNISDEYCNGCSDGC